jgi:hypothetical protein
VAGPVDYVQLALSSTRVAFVLASPYTFIVSDGTLPRLTGPHRTVPLEKVDFLATQEAPAVADKLPGRAFMAFALRKVSDTFPHMISVGRTNNNDLVVPDMSISKLHAFFSHSPRGFEVADAGSKNGTWLGGEPLQPRQPRLIKLGDRLRFGRIEFTVVDAGVCWDTVDRMRR